MFFIVVFIENILMGILATWIFEFILQNNKKLRDRYYRRHEVLFGYHVHHSTIGLLVMAAGGIFFLSGNFLTGIGMIGFGIGIIMMHTISSRRFVFIERETFSESASKESYPQPGS